MLPKIYAISAVFIALSSGTYAHSPGQCSAINNENATIKKIINSKRSTIINSHSLPRVKDGETGYIPSTSSAVCVIEDFDPLASHSYEKLIQRSSVDNKLYLVYKGGISGNDRHVFGPLIDTPNE